MSDEWPGGAHHSARITHHSIIPVVTAAPQTTITLNDLLIYMAKQEASDLHLKPMRPPLVRKKVIDLSRLIDLMTCGPARTFRLPGGTLAKGSPGDVALFDLQAAFEVRPPFHSKASNSPFIGQTLRGRAVTTIVGGVVKYSRK